MDNLTPEQRKKNMQRIRSKDTKPELVLRKAVFSLGIRYRLHTKDVFGKPDICIKKYKLAVFIDSDFWHGWQYPRWEHLLKNDFWRDKIERNRARDKKTTAFLRRNGWKVIRIWEHQIKNENDKCVAKIVNVFI